MKPRGTLKTGQEKINWIWMLLTLMICLLLPLAAFADTEDPDYDREAHVESVINSAKKRVEENPNDPNAYADLGGDLTWAKRYDEAVEAFTTAIEMNPNNPDIHKIYNRRGHAYTHINYELAIADYTRAIELSSDIGVYYSNRARAYDAMGNADAAEADRQMSTGLAPDKSLPFRQRGNAYFDERKYDEAIAEYTMGLEVVPGHGNIYHSRGNAYFHQLKYDEAVADYTRAIELFPESHQYYSARGAAYYFLRKYDLAAEDYSKAIELRREITGTDYIYRARAHYALGNYAAASADLQKTLDVTTGWLKWDNPCWIGGLFMLPDFNLALAVPSGAVTLTEEALAVTDTRTRLPSACGAVPAALQRSALNSEMDGWA